MQKTEKDLKELIEELKSVAESKKVELLTDRLIWTFVEYSEKPEERICVMLDFVRLPREILSPEAKAAIFMGILTLFSLGRWMEEWNVIKKIPVWELVSLPEPEMQRMHDKIFELIEKTLSLKETGEGDNEEVSIRILADFLAEETYTDEDKAKLLTIFVDVMYCGSEVLEETDDFLERILEEGISFEDRSSKIN